MQIEQNRVVIDSAIDDEGIFEFLAVAKQKEVEIIDIQNSELSSSVIQAISCLAKEREVVCEDPFLKKVFAHITHA